LASKLHHNKRLWQKHVLAENRRDIPGLLATLIDDPLYIVMATGQEYKGKEGVASFYQGLFDGLPDATFDLVGVTIGEEMVVEESRFWGTHNGPLFNIPATGKYVTFPLIIMFPVVGEKFGGERMYFDMNTLLHGMGLADTTLERILKTST
jgi:steroid delta-isomerase-like uncharacterized protein